MATSQPRRRQPQRPLPVASASTLVLTVTPSTTPGELKISPLRQAKTRVAHRVLAFVFSFSLQEVGLASRGVLDVGDKRDASWWVTLTIVQELAWLRPWIPPRRAYQAPFCCSFARIYLTPCPSISACIALRARHIPPPSLCILRRTLLCRLYPTAAYSSPCLLLLPKPIHSCTTACAVLSRVWVLPL